MALDDAGVCEECRRAAGKTKDSSNPSQRLNPPIIVCEERERLAAAYRDAMQAKLEFESRIDSEIMSANPHAKRRAKNELKRAEKHYYRFMDELMAHEKKHGCGS
jgi:predicted metal-binding protein